MQLSTPHIEQRTLTLGAPLLCACGSDDVMSIAPGDAPEYCEPNPLHCPHCGHRLSLKMVATAKAESVLHFRIAPAPGELLDAGTVGGSLAALRDLLRSANEDCGAPTEVLLKSAKTDAEGAVDFEVVVVRFREAVERRERQAAAKQRGSNKGE